MLHADVVMDPEGKSRGFGTVRSGTTKHNPSLHQPHLFTSSPSPHYINITSPPLFTSPHYTSPAPAQVLFATTRDAAKAIQLFNESVFGSRTIEVRPDQFQGR